MFPVKYAGVNQNGNKGFSFNWNSAWNLKRNPLIIIFNFNYFTLYMYDQPNTTKYSCNSRATSNRVLDGKKSLYLIKISTMSPLYALSTAYPPLGSNLVCRNGLGWNVWRRSKITAWIPEKAGGSWRLCESSPSWLP